MKTTFLFCTLVAASPLFGQTATQPAAAPRPPSTGLPMRSGLPSSPVNPGLPASPTAPGLPGSPTAPGLPGFTNAFGLGSPSFTNTFGTNFSFQNLSALLANLENDIQLTLPALAAFNDHFAFYGEALMANANRFGTNAAGTARDAAFAATPSASGQNFGANFGANVSSRAGVNAGVNASVAPGASRPATAAGTATAGHPAVTPGGVSVPTPTGPNSPYAWAQGSPGTGGAANVVTPAMRDTFRALLVLQSDMERMLPILAAMTDGTPGGAALGGFPGNYGFGSGTNNYPYTGGAAVTNSPGGAGTVPLFPTGRSTFGRPAPGTGTGAAGAGTSSGTGASGAGGTTGSGTGASGAGTAPGSSSGASGSGSSGSAGGSR